MSATMSSLSAWESWANSDALIVGNGHKSGLLLRVFGAMSVGKPGLVDVEQLGCRNKIGATDVLGLAVYPLMDRGSLGTRGSCEIRSSHAGFCHGLREAFRECAHLANANCVNVSHGLHCNLSYG